MLKDKTIKYYFLLPLIVWVLSINIFPLLYILRTSFMDWTFGMPSRFIGIKNYASAVIDVRMLGSLWFTFQFVVVTVITEVVLGFFLALLFNKEIQGTKTFRAIMTLPLFAAPVAVAYIGVLLFHEEYGPINAVLSRIGIAPINWLATAGTAKVTIMMLDIWQWTPFTFIIFLAGLQSLPIEPYEAAIVDGARPRQILRYVTIPMLTPILMTAIAFKTVYSLKVFDIPFALTQGGPGTTTEVLGMYIFRQGLEFFNIGYASTLSIIFLIMITILSSLLLRRMRNVY
ncbi:MAG: sugar ABC transporter permease [Candidatus Atribacteria bacterium]|nr:sugar ABC transporter permease [Candidatus Atribacteria bacterium]